MSDEPKTDAELRQLAIRNAGGSMVTSFDVFCKYQDDPDAAWRELEMMFMVLALASVEQRKQISEQYALIYGLIPEHAFEMSVNGMPSFHTFAGLSEEEMHRYFPILRDVVGAPA